MGTRFEAFKQLMLKVKLTIKRKNKELGESDIFTKQAEGDCLSRLADMKALSREYYGDDKNNKPNDKCFWDDTPFCFGWYENDDSLRKRIMKVKGL